jgi:hypothetical protein
MQYHINVGTTLSVQGPTGDDYVIEKIHRADVDGTRRIARIEARTVRQRCFPRELTSSTIWTSAELLAQLEVGTLRIQG